VAAGLLAGLCSVAGSGTVVGAAVHAPRKCLT
jgi:hypothetical protein